MICLTLNECATLDTCRAGREKSRPDYLMKLKQCCESVWFGEEEGDDIQKNLTIAQVCRSG